MEKQIKKYLGLITVTAFVTAVAYLYAYWSSFGINVFEFVDISNIIIYSIVPLIFGMLAVLCSLNSIFFLQFYPKLLSDIFKRAYRLTKFNCIIELLFAFFIFIILVYSISIALRNYAQWVLVPFSFIILLVYIVSFLLKWLKRLRRFFPDPGIKIILFLIIIYLPIHSATIGWVKAEAIKRGDMYRYVDGDSINEEVRKRGDDKIRYIGTMGDYFFFLIPSDKLPSDKTIYIAAKEEIKPFILKRYRRQKNKE